MRGGDFNKVARAGYTFRSFSHNYLNLISHMMLHQGVAGKVAAARSLRNVVIMGGLNSMPFIALLTSVLMWALGDEDKDFMTEVRSALPNEWMRDIVVYGLPGVAGWDLSGSLSIEVPRNMKEIIGVPYAVYEDTANMFKSARAGNLTRAFSESPVTPIMVRNAMRGISLATEGHRTRGGRDINYPGESGARKLSGAEAAAKILGFQPTSVSKGYAAYQAVRKMTTTIQEKKRAWADRYVNAQRKNDRKGMVAVRKEIAKWNADARKAGEAHRVVDISRMVKSRLADGKKAPKVMRQEEQRRVNVWAPKKKKQLTLRENIASIQ
jgi:hypothetical protein